MKILMILDHEFPPDDRVEKEAISLSMAGHEIHIACFTMENRAEHEVEDHYIIRRRAISRLLYKSSAAQLFIPWYWNFWKRFVKDLFQENNYDAIHIHDLPLTKIGYELKKLYGTKLICDQHEYYSDWIVRTPHYNTIPGKIVKTFSNWRSYEKFYLSRADAVITVEKPLKEIYIRKVGLSEKAVLVIPNTPLKHIFRDENVKSNIPRKYENRFVLIYLGGLDQLRGLSLAFKAVRILKKSIPELLLLLVGNKSKFFDFQKLAEDQGILDHFEWIPFQPIELLPSYIAASDIGFFTPQLNREEINRTIATKIYQYLAMGKPVIVSKARMMQELIEKNRIGFAVDDKDPNEFALMVLEIFNNPDLKSEMERNSKMLSEKYLWEITVTPLVDLYNNLNN